MYAVIETGGKQYLLENGDLFDHELVEGIEAGETVSFDKVLLIVDEGEVRVGTPYLEGVKVTGEVREQGRGDKVIVYKYKSKKGYRRKQGHRQSYMKTKITAIEA
ncbi:50S ribosomal protein L21 [Candidatus Bipolaricaulota bacterium]|nr:50S ribosomal protein L21 [Candidatus Bipolaricaulota bacterium]HHR85716.1 50S ribosomal protein L21 [Candidatus Acetothermia bacterium]